MSDHHNQYHRQQQDQHHHQEQHHQHEQQQHSPYPIRMPGREQSHHPQHLQHHPQHYHMRGQPPHLSNSVHQYPDLSSGNSASSGSHESSSSSNSNSNKRLADSISTKTPPSSAVNTSRNSSPSGSVAARTPLSVLSPAVKRTPPTSTTATGRSTKKARKSSPRSSPSGDGGSVKSTGTNAAKGLRHFSMMVCQKVEEKGTTTYNEVADELVKKVVAERKEEDPSGSFDQKNIRRRVYDALNVLMAMDIISKEKKEIIWKGLPTAAKQDLDSIEKEIECREQQVAQKKEALRDLLIQQVCFRNLVQRNHQLETANKQQRKVEVPDGKIPLPFLVVNTDKLAETKCDMSKDLTYITFNFSLPFGVSDDNTILKGMQMDRTTMTNLRQMFPKQLLHYCESNRLTHAVLGRGDPNEESLPPLPHHRQHQRHEILPPPPLHTHSYHHPHLPPTTTRGGISIGGGSSSGGSSGSSSRLGRVALHQHHLQHQQHHPYDQHGRMMSMPARRPQSHPPHRHSGGPPPMPGSSVSSSRQSSSRDRYSY